jgi:hypothetical protein
MKSRPDAPDAALARVIAAMGLADVDEAERTWFENELRKIKQDYLNRLRGIEEEANFRILLRKFLVNADARSKLRSRLAPFAAELARTRQLRLNNTPTPDEESIFILSLLTDPRLLAKAEQAETDNILTYLSTSEDYKKDPIRKLVAEPFLALLRDEGVIGEDMSSSRELPLNAMMASFLDFVGIPRSRHPTNIRVIVAHVRGLEKRPRRRTTPK